jgi:hypothetical protein
MCEIAFFVFHKSNQRTSAFIVLDTTEDSESAVNGSFLKYPLFLVLLKHYLIF